MPNMSRTVLDLELLTQLLCLSSQTRDRMDPVRVLDLVRVVDLELGMMKTQTGLGMMMRLADG